MIEGLVSTFLKKSSLSGLKKFLNSYNCFNVLFLRIKSLFAYNDIFLILLNCACLNIILNLFLNFRRFQLGYSYKGPYIYEVHIEGGGGQKNTPQIADTMTFKVRNWAKIVDFKQFYADVINVCSLNCILIKKVCHGIMMFQ